MLDVFWVAWPVSTVQTLSLAGCLEAPTRFGLDDSLHASISFFRMYKHSRNVEKNGWCDRMQREVSEWFRILLRLREARGDGEWLPPDSESADGPVTPSRGGCCIWPPPACCCCCCCVDVPVPCCCDGGSESRLLEQSRSESLGATLLLLWSLEEVKMP